MARYDSARAPQQPNQIKKPGDILSRRAWKDTPQKLLPKSATKLERLNESSHHLGIIKVAVELVQLIEPEVEAFHVAIRRVVWIASQVTEVLHQHKGAVELAIDEGCIFDDLTQDLRAG